MKSGKNFLFKWFVNISVSYFMCIAYLFVAGIVFSMLGMKMLEISVWSPFLEESMRFLSILIGSYVTYLFTLFFSVGEFIQHIDVYSTQHGGRIPFEFIIFRFICVIAHFLLLAIQLFGFKLSKKYNSKLYAYVGLLVAMLWHYAFNTGLGRIIYNYVHSWFGLL